MIRSLFAFLLLSACSSDPTRVDVFFEADEASVADAVSLRLLVLSADDTLQLDDTRELSGLSFPTGVRVVPREDTAASFEVVGRLLDREGTTLQEARVRSRFVPEQGRELWLRFVGGCAATECGPRETCRSGTCVGACAAAQTPPVDVKPTPTRLCTQPDGGVDGGADGGDAGDAGSDAFVDGAADVQVDAADGGMLTRFVRTQVERHQTTGDTWRPVTGATTTIPGDGRQWLLAISGRLGGELFPHEGEIRVTRTSADGDVVDEVGTANRDGNGEPGPYFGPFALLDVVDAAEPIDVDVELRGTRSATIGVLEDLIIVAIPLPEGSLTSYEELRDYDVELFDGSTGGAWVSDHRVAIPAGEQLVLISAVGIGPDEGTGLEFRVDDGTGDHWPLPSDGARRHMTTTPQLHQSLFLARRSTVAQEIGIQSRAARPACAMEEPPCEPSATIESMRIIIIDLDAFAPHLHTEDPTPVSSSSDTWITRSSLNASPDEPTLYWVAQSVMAFGGNPRDDRGTGRRGVRLRAGPRERTFDHQYDWRENRLPYALFDVFEVSEPFVVTNEYSSPEAIDSIESKESVIHLLQLP